MSEPPSELLLQIFIGFLVYLCFEISWKFHDFLKFYATIVFLGSKVEDASCIGLFLSLKNFSRLPIFTLLQLSLVLRQLFGQEKRIHSLHALVYHVVFHLFEYLLDCLEILFIIISRVLDLFLLSIKTLLSYFSFFSSYVFHLSSHII